MNIFGLGLLVMLGGALIGRGLRLSEWGIKLMSEILIWNNLKLDPLNLALVASVLAALSMVVTYWGSAMVLLWTTHAVLAFFFTLGSLYTFNLEWTHPLT